MGGLATGIITLAIGLAKHFPKEKHLILVQEDNQNSSFEEDFILPKNLSVIKLKKFGPKFYPIAFNMQKTINNKEMIAHVYEAALKSNSGDVIVATPDKEIIDVIKNKTDLSMIDMEDITRHYAETLNRWRKNFMNVLPEIKEMGYSKAFINMWEFYFLYCEAGFLERNIGDVQLVFAKSGARDVRVEY